LRKLTMLTSMSAEALLAAAPAAIAQADPAVVVDATTKTADAGCAQAEA
jgi:hypothetical protein